MKTNVPIQLTTTQNTSNSTQGNKTKETAGKKKIEKSLQKILDNLIEGCQIIDFNFRYIYVNDAVAKQGHRAKEELLEHTMMEIYPGIEKTEMFSNLTHCMQKREPWRMENEFTYPDGSHGWFELRMEPIPEGVFIFSLDITEKKSVEEKFRVLFENSLDVIHIMNTKFKVSFVTPSIKNVLGYTPEEFKTLNVSSIVHPKDIKLVEQTYQTLIMYPGSNIGPIQERIKHKDGSWRWLEVIGINLMNTIGIRGIVITSRDITDRKKAEEAIKSKSLGLERANHSQEDTRKALLNVMEDLETAKALIELEKVKDEAMLASIGEGLIAVDKNRKIMIINKAAEEMLGWKSKELIGKEMTSIIRMEDERGHVVPLNKRPTYIALTTEKPISKNNFFVRKDKTKFPMAINVTPIKLGREIIGAINIFRDITYEKEIDLAKSEFVALASHQLRTPLGIMKWYLEALGNEDYFGKSPTVIQKYYEEICKSNERVLSLVRDLLSVSRIEQGRIKNMPKPADLIQIIKAIVEQLQIVAHKKNIDLHLTVQNNKIPSINIDILRFHEVLENLIANAIEYTMPTGSVDVAINKIDDTIFISVKDTGIGISEADQKKLFTKFFRSEKATGHNPEGSGLGLYVVKAYVEGWGGKVSVESIDGHGSTFTLSLPIIQKKPL